jgi:hypothetical protein
MLWEFFASQEKNPDFKSRAIMQATGWDCSHVGIIYGGFKIWHATGIGLHSLEGEKFDEFMRLHNLPHRFALPVRNSDYARGYCRGNEGKDYSESQLVGFKVPGLRDGLGDGEAELICSEFVIRFANEFDILNLHCDLDPDFIDPKTCMEIMRKLVK